MNISRIRLFFCFILIFSLIAATAATAAAAPPDAHAPAEALTRGEAAALVYQAAKKYNPELRRETIMIGYGDGNLYEDRPVAYYELLVMLANGFGALPECAGNNARIAAEADISGAPPWAAPAAENLKAAGALCDPDDGLGVILPRIYRLLGSRPQDDFYEYVNKEWLDTAGFPEGIPQNGAMVEIMLTVQDQLEKLLDGLAGGEHAPGSGAQKVSALYKNALDMDARNADGYKPAAPYLDKIRAVKNLDELTTVSLELTDSLGFFYFASFIPVTSFTDSSAKAPLFYPIGVTLPKEDYASDDSPRIAPYLWYMARLQELCGVPEGEAAEKAEAVFAMEKDIASAMMQPHELADFSVSYQSHSLAEIAAMFPGVDVEKIYKSIGMRAANKDKIIVADIGMAKKAGEWFSEERLDTLKAYLEIKFINDVANSLSGDFLEANDIFNAALSGVDSPQTPKQRAMDLTLNLMDDYIGRMYVEAYASEKVKSDVEGMIGEFIGVYRERIKKLDWMGEATKEQAVKKLDALSVKVGWPDRWNDPLKGVELLGYGEGGSLFQNIGAIGMAGWKKMIEEQDYPVNKSAWIAAPYTVNAFNNMQNNEIIVPYAFLNPPVYDANASRSANLGALGMVIAHELTHAFDSSGSQFDEDGDVADWWTEEDHEAFASLCADVAVFYDGVEAAPGIYNNGMLTLGENVSDLAAISCALEVAMKDPDFNAEEFFTAGAVWWKRILPRLYVDYFSLADVHSDNRIRSNLQLQNVDLFYETYDVQPGDGMYVPEFKRIRIW